MMNVGNPDQAFSLAVLPNDGVGLARIEFIISSTIQVHPLALLLPGSRRRRRGARRDRRADSRPRQRQADFFVDRLAEGVAMIAAAFYPKDVIVRLSDFKTNEYAGLLGGRDFEPKEENPMLGFRGASRYYAPALPRGVRARVPRDAQGARGDGPDQRQADGPVLPHAEEGAPGRRELMARARAAPRRATGSRSTSCARSPPT